MVSIFSFIMLFVEKRDNRGKERTGSDGKFPLPASFMFKFAFLFSILSGTERYMAGEKKANCSQNKAFHRITEPQNG